MKNQIYNIVWLRRDLRLDDQAAIYHALREGHPVLPVFIFDPEILKPLPHPIDHRVQFIYETLESLRSELETLGSTLWVFYGKPVDIFKKLISENKVASVYVNHDYEPSAIARDAQVHTLLRDNKVEFKTFKDQVIFEKREVVKDDNKPYTVFTPYKKKWLKVLSDFYLKPYPNKDYFKNWAQKPKKFWVTLEDLGFKSDPDFKFPSTKIDKASLKTYGETRDFPALDSTSRLGLHLRFGTVSIRHLATVAKATNETWLSELIWRDFFMQILFHFPHVVKESFRPEYDKIEWRNNKAEFKAWCEGRTGYPLVDAGMRELNTTGYMHNRVRMVTASFLTKHLLTDWRLGERYFAEKLLDYDLSANNGNWQWAAGTGCDAAPYFRVFNPEIQCKKFDNKLEYTRKWVPEFGSKTYPEPIVEHSEARDRALAAYKKALKTSKA